MNANETQTDRENLPAWRRARELVKMIYKMTASFPEGERFGLTMRMRRSAVAVISGIAEACGSREQRPHERSLDIARGSAYELESLLIIAGDLGFAYAVAEEIEAVHKLMKELDSLIDGEVQGGAGLTD
jgi:four helix bundle protein